MMAGASNKKLFFALVWPIHAWISSACLVGSEMCIRDSGSLGSPPPLVLYKNGKYKNFNDVPSAWENSFINSTRDYINCLLNGKKPMLTGEQGKEILRMALAAELSSSEGRSIKINDERLS